MLWLCMIEYVVVAVIVIQLVRLLLADADLTVLWKEKFGAKPEILKGDVVWITGASSGIGEYLAYDLARAGCRLVLSARRQQELQRVKKQCLSQGHLWEEDVLVLPLDVLKYDTHKDATQKVLDTFGKIDILVNNSGRLHRGWLHETDLEVDRQLMDINYLSVLSLTKAVLPHMMSHNRGHVVVTSSVAGKLASPFSAAYSGSKFAVQGWCETLRTEMVNHNIKVTMICPGPVKSNILENVVAPKAVEGSSKAKVNSCTMSTERCTELISVAIANRLDEVWIAHNPILFVTYLSQYFPSVTRIFQPRIGMKTIMKLRYNSS